MTFELFYMIIELYRKHCTTKGGTTGLAFSAPLPGESRKKGDIEYGKGFRFMLIQVE